MKKPIIVAVVGLIGAGKSEAVGRFVAHGFIRFGFNDVIYEEVARQGLTRTEQNERVVREGLRKNFGMAIVAERLIPKISAAVGKGDNVVLESLYSWAEYKVMRERFGEEFCVCAIYAPPQVRYRRLAARAERPFDKATAISREDAEIENLQKGGPIAIADWTIQNLGDDKEEFLSTVDEVIEHEILV